MEDPWGLDSACERSRFQWTNDLITRYLPPIGSILEVGCGEGHQSVYLSQVCRSLYGIDVSKRAIRRASYRCPQAKFAVGDPFDFSFSPLYEPIFDLVIACEVIYYCKDVTATLRRLGVLGRVCLVTYDDSQVDRLDPYIAALGCSQSDAFRCGDDGWIARWWKNRK
jgi:SAM-dependent methyltransferase